MAQLSSRPDIPEEAELLRRARGKDRRAIRLIIQHHNQRLFLVARIVMNEALGRLRRRRASIIFLLSNKTWFAGFRPP
jgi:hypothetical protein